MENETFVCYNTNLLFSFFVYSRLYYPIRSMRYLVIVYLYRIDFIQQIRGVYVKTYFFSV